MHLSALKKMYQETECQIYCVVAIFLFKVALLLMCEASHAIRNYLHIYIG